MSNRLLTDAERNRFAEWLEQNAESCRLLIGQLEKFSHSMVVAQSLKQECAASLIIAKKLRETEILSVGIGDGASP